MTYHLPIHTANWVSLTNDINQFSYHAAHKLHVLDQVRPTFWTAQATSSTFGLHSGNMQVHA